MRASAPEYDVTLVVPALTPVRDHARAGHYDALADALVALNDEDEAAMPVACWIAADEEPLEQALARRLERHPGDFLARTLHAQRQIVVAWQARGRGPAASVSPERFAAFTTGLQRAEVALIQACAEDPSWTMPWYLRLVTARGLELGIPETRRRYDRLAELDPHHYEGQREMLQRLCPKWGGSWEEAFAFARSCATAAPSGSFVPALVADAHLELWVSLPAKEGREYLRRGDVRDEVDRAARDSVLHARARSGPSTVRVRTVLGALHAVAGDTAAADQHFRALGGVVDDGVWGYLGASERVVDKCRTAALAGA